MWWPFKKKLTKCEPINICRHCIYYNNVTCDLVIEVYKTDFVSGLRHGSGGCYRARLKHAKSKETSGSRVPYCPKFEYKKGTA